MTTGGGPGGGSGDDPVGEIDARLAALERRLERVEDELAIMRIIAAYGPAVDSGSPEATADMWCDDGIYDVFPRVLQGRAEIEAMVSGDLHQGLIGAGAAHLQGSPLISIDGDTATVTHYSQLALRDATTDSFRIWRTGVNVWTFVRTPAGWRATRRVNRQLDGTGEARELLRDAAQRARRAAGREGL